MWQEPPSPHVLGTRDANTEGSPSAVPKVPNVATATSGGGPTSVPPPTQEEGLPKKKARHEESRTTVIYEDGSRYTGPLRNGKRHGQGIYTFLDGGSYYVGEFKDDKKHGQGTTTFPNGASYVGEYEDDTYHGQGTYTHLDGAVHKGEWKNGYMHQGTLTFPSGYQGTLTFPSGYVYKGEFGNGYMHGQGKMFDAQGNVYQQGKWLDDIFIDEAEALARAPFLADEGSLSKTLECPICTDSLDDPMEFRPKDPKQSCKHSACRTCVIDFIRPKCDTCSQILVTAGSAHRVDICPDCLEEGRLTCPVCRVVIAAVEKTGNLEGHQHRHDIDHAPVPEADDHDDLTGSETESDDNE